MCWRSTCPLSTPRRGCERREVERIAAGRADSKGSIESSIHVGEDGIDAREAGDVVRIDNAERADGTGRRRVIEEPLEVRPVGGDVDEHQLGERAVRIVVLVERVFRRR